MIIIRIVRFMHNKPFHLFKPQKVQFNCTHNSNQFTKCIITILGINFININTIYLFLLKRNISDMHTVEKLNDTINLERFLQSIKTYFLQLIYFRYNPHLQNYLKMKNNS